MLIKNFPIIFKFFVRKSKIVLKKGVLIIIFKMRDKYIITFCSQTLELYQHSGCNRFSNTLKHRKKNKISVQILDIFSINCLTRIVKISQPLSLFSLSRTGPRDEILPKRHWMCHFQNAETLQSLSENQFSTEKRRNFQLSHFTTVVCGRNISG
jgi:hypothetical protein